jgi:gamma-glutamyltranspeptidase
LKNHSRLTFYKIIIEELAAMGYAFVDEDAESRILGITEGIMIDRVNKIIYGASDPRGGGLAVGY